MTATADIVVKRVKDALLVPSAALRFALPVQEEAPKRSSGGLIGALIPHPPTPLSGQRDKTTEKKSQQKVWVLKDGKPVPVPVTVGWAAGGMTEVVAGDIGAGTSVVVDTLAETK